MAIGKSTHTFETCLFDKLDQFFKVLLRFTRMAHHQGCTDMDTRNFFTDAFQQSIRFFLRDIAAHFCKHRIADML